ncbi:MAG: LysM peptidoglycan-binding domain-containing protein [Gammaproteobacteria bacterium]|nr:LysM peptidoglycan-binding domain-containing protein [Gammaproteobacteria bacterium]
MGVPAAFLTLLAGCSSLTSREPPSTAPVAAVTPPASPSIPAPVPVGVRPSGRAPSADLDAELASIIAPDLSIPEPMAPPGDLLERVRAGLALGDVRHSRIDREAIFYARNPEYVERVFTRAAPYLHYIVGEVEQRGLPLELALLPIIESAFQPYAYSRARADGLWQFIPSTGGRFGLKQDWWYDGRRDVVAATQAALDYLTYLHDMFDGDWLAAIAAYNCGEGNVSRAIRRNRAAKMKTDFWNLKLPSETRTYVPRLLAMSDIVAHPEKYGLSIEGMPDIPYFVRVETGGQISMEVAAELAGVTTEEMYDLNPAFHRWATDPTGPHHLLVPVESAVAFSESLLQLTPDQRMRVERYTVRAGDTLTSVAQRFATTTQHLRELNELPAPASQLAEGAELRVPSAVSALPPRVLQAAARVDARSRRGQTVRAVHVVRRGDSLWSIAQRHKMDVVTLANLNRIDPNDTLRAGQRLVLHAQEAGSTAAAESADGRRVTYVVRRGDTLSDIARTLRVTVASLREWNNISGSSIRAGQKLVAYVRRRS